MFEMNVNLVYVYSITHLYLYIDLDIYKQKKNPPFKRLVFKNTYQSYTQKVFA